MLISALLLGGFAVIGTAMVALTHEATAERIAANHRARLLKSLHLLVTPEMHDNDLVTDMITVTDKELLGTDKPVRVWRARKDGKPVAVIINSVAPDGYNGRIELLVAIRQDGTLLGVRVISHHETPGLGDAIEAEKSNWIHSFDNHSLKDPDPKHWKVKRDGGVFDQFTGATITPRAVVKAVYRTLVYFEKHRDELFDRPAEPMEEIRHE
ncbi:MAG TPA: electron transport complex subunit RsxG [Gammaproteobacteria bacterium]|nr:electron transport complex subunit RsxG [Gammaproteobacteria bacterium]